MFQIPKVLIKSILDSVLLSGVVARPRPRYKDENTPEDKKRESPWYDIPEGKTLLIDADTLCIDQGKEWCNWMIEQADQKRWGIVFYQKGQLEFRNEDVKKRYQGINFETAKHPFLTLMKQDSDTLLFTFSDELANAARIATESLDRVHDVDNFYTLTTQS